MSDRIPMTRTGFNKIKAEMDRLQHEERPKIELRVAEARSEGDLSENTEYHGARESLGLLDAKIFDLNSKLANAILVDTSKLPKDEVVFGCTVKVKDLDLDDEETFILVGGGEEDYDAGKILVSSPLGQGLVGKKVGEVAEIEVPAGKMRFKILDLSFEDA